MNKRLRKKIMGDTLPTRFACPKCRRYSLMTVTTSGMNPFDQASPVPNQYCYGCKWEGKMLQHDYEKMEQRYQE